MKNDCVEDCIFNVGGYCTLIPELEDARKQKQYVRVRIIKDKLNRCKNKK